MSPTQKKLKEQVAIKQGVGVGRMQSLSLGFPTLFPPSLPKREMAGNFGRGFGAARFNKGERGDVATVGERSRNSSFSTHHQDQSMEILATREIGSASSYP